MSTTIDPSGQIIDDLLTRTRTEFEDLLRTAQEQFRVNVSASLATAQKQLHEAAAKLSQNLESANGFAKANSDAVIASGDALRKGVEAMNREIAVYARARVEQSVAAGERLMAARSLGEAASAQTDFARDTLQAFLTEAGKLQELTMRVSTEATAPLTARLEDAAREMTRSVSR